MGQAALTGTPARTPRSGAARAVIPADRADDWAATSVLAATNPERVPRPNVQARLAMLRTASAPHPPLKRNRRSPATTPSPRTCAGAGSQVRSPRCHPRREGRPWPDAGAEVSGLPGGDMARSLARPNRRYPSAVLTDSADRASAPGA